MKWLVALFIITLFVAGCGQNEITGDVVGEIDISEWDELLSQCPECEKCPACPVCEECPECEECEECERCPKCPKCEKCPDPSRIPIDLELDAVRLYKQDETDVEEEELTFEYSESQFEDLKSAELSFTANCEEAKKRLTIEVNGDRQYYRVPPCEETVTVEIAKRDLKEGVNKVTFSAEVEDSYRLEDIELKSENEDDTDKEDLGYVRLEEPFVTKKTVKELDDVEITSIVEYDVSISRNDAKEDLYLEFDGSERDGKLQVYVNGRRIFEGKISKSNEIKIAKKYLDNGKNEIKFVGISD